MKIKISKSQWEKIGKTAGWVKESASGKCPSCNVSMINGVRCHENGCPDAHKEYKKECPGCGSSFYPKTRHQKYCHRCS
jgi:hypothetical protein